MSYSLFWTRNSAKAVGLEQGFLTRMDLSHSVGLSVAMQQLGCMPLFSSMKELKGGSSPSKLERAPSKAAWYLDPCSSCCSSSLAVFWQGSARGAS